jgi:hypothetical protein
MDHAELLTLYDRQQRIEIEHPGMRKDIFPNLIRFVRPAPGMSAISYSQLDDASADRAIDEQVAYFREHNLPFSWKVYEHDTPTDLKERLAARGCKMYEQEDILVLDLEAVPASLLEPSLADIRTLNHPEQLEDVIRVEEQVWGGNFAWIRKRLGEHLAIPGYLSVYAAYVNDQPACAGWIYFRPNSFFADLWGGSTVAEQRGQGLYTALLAVRVQEAQRRGYRFLTIDAGPMSGPIVRRHGFQLLTRAWDCDWETTPEESNP